MFNSTFLNSIIHSTRPYTYLRTRTYLYFFFKGLTQISRSTLNHVSRYRLFIPNGLNSINETSYYHIKKPLSFYFSWFDSPLSVLSFYKYLYKYFTHVVKRSRSWKTSLCTYFLFVSYLIQVTPCQPSGWTWHHPVTLQPLKLLPNIITHQTLPCVHFVFISRSLIISLENISSVSTNYSRAVSR